MSSMFAVAKNVPKNKITFSVSLSIELVDEIDELLSGLDMRTRSYVAEKLLRRGLAAMKRDGSFDEPVSSPNEMVQVKEEAVNLDKGLKRATKRVKVE